MFASLRSVFRPKFPCFDPEEDGRWFEVRKRNDVGWWYEARKKTRWREVVGR